MWSAVDDVLMSEDNVELVGRGRHNERQSLLAATHRHVALIGRRRLTQHGIEMTSRVGSRRRRSRRPCRRLQWTGKMAAITKAEVVESDTDGLPGTDDHRPRGLGSSTAGDVADDTG